MTPHDGTSSRADYWADRFKLAQTDPDEARALLVEFSTLAADGRDADVLLVQWVADAIRRWALTSFQPQAAGKAFHVSYPRGRRLNSKAANSSLAEHHKNKVDGIAMILKLSREEGYTLEEAAAVAAHALSLNGKGVTADELLVAYEERGRLSPADWVPMFMAMDSATQEAVCKPAKAGPKARSK